MRLIVILIVGCLFTLSLDAQNLTGIWRGYFYSGSGNFKIKYKYEVQINQLPNKGLKGVTYSYRTTVFYGKASLQGIYMTKTKSLILKEDKLLEVKTIGSDVACLMTCYLDYSKQSGDEILQGTFTSINVKDKSNCGSGTVFLYKVEESDFYKEDFLVKKVPFKTQTIPPKKALTKPTTDPKNSLAKNNASANKQTIKSKSTKPSTPFVKKEDTKVIMTPPKTEKSLLPPKIITPTPLMIKQRENILTKKIITTSPEIRIELYDNGSIDNDTVTVYHNNELVVYKKKLSYLPITINIHAKETEGLHEIIMVADNLGDIPPNTASMIVTTGGKRYEVSLISTEQKNAKVVIEYQNMSK